MKYFVLADTTPKAQNLYNKLILLLPNISQKVQNCNTIIVIGGDGFMINSIKNYYQFNKAFFGINSGNCGFLLNDFDHINCLINNNLIDLKKNFLHIEYTNLGSTKQMLALNDFYLWRQAGQVLKINLELSFNGYNFNKYIEGDGLIMATTLGSSAYNLSAGGRALPLDNNLIALTPININKHITPWQGAICPPQSILKLSTQEPLKRCFNACIDNVPIQLDTCNFTLALSNLSFNLLFTPRDYYNKIKITQF